MSKRAKTTDSLDQAKRFREAARSLGADQDEGALDRVFGKVVPPVLPEAKRAPWPTYRVAPGGSAPEGWVVVPEPTPENPHPAAVAAFDTKVEAEAEAERRNIHAGK